MAYGLLSPRCLHISSVLAFSAWLPRWEAPSPRFPARDLITAFSLRGGTLSRSSPPGEGRAKKGGSLWSTLHSVITRRSRSITTREVREDALALFDTSINLGRDGCITQ